MDRTAKRFADGPLNERIARLAAAGRKNITRLDAELDEMEPPAKLDAANRDKTDRFVWRFVKPLE
jgi:predicted methyltransferase